MQTVSTNRRGELRFGLRSMLLIVATLMFLLALLLNENAFDVAMIGLAALSGAMLVGDLGFERRGPTD